MRKLCSMINYDLTEREEGASTTCYITWGKEKEDLNSEGAIAG
jgi:hypothetical protein